MKALLKLLFKLGLDRLLLLLLGWKTVNVFYHSITPVYDPEFKTVALADFERQMRYFKKHFQVLPLGVKGKRRSITISFDDGFLNNLTVALPILIKYDIPATIFVVGSIEKEGNQAIQLRPWADHSFEKIESWRMLDPGTLKALASSELITIGSHGYDHVKLTKIESYDGLVNNLRESKKTLEKIIKKPVKMLAFPYGDYDDYIVSHARRIGYTHFYAVTPNPKAGKKDINFRFGISGKTTFEVNIINLVKFWLWK